MRCSTTLGLPSTLQDSHSICPHHPSASIFLFCSPSSTHPIYCPMRLHKLSPPATHFHKPHPSCSLVHHRYTYNLYNVSSSTCVITKAPFYLRIFCVAASISGPLSSPCALRIPLTFVFLFRCVPWVSKDPGHGSREMLGVRGGESLGVPYIIRCSFGRDGGCHIHYTSIQRRGQYDGPL